MKKEKKKHWNQQKGLQSWADRKDNGHKKIRKKKKRKEREREEEQRSRGSRAMILSLVSVVFPCFMLSLMRGPEPRKLVVITVVVMYPHGCPLTLLSLGGSSDDHFVSRHVNISNSNCIDNSNHGLFFNVLCKQMNGKKCR